MIIDQDIHTGKRLNLAGSFCNVVFGPSLLLPHILLNSNGNAILTIQQRAF